MPVAMDLISIIITIYHHLGVGGGWGLECWVAGGDALQNINTVPVSPISANEKQASITLFSTDI